MNPFIAEILCLYKLWRPKGFFQFEIIINVLVSSYLCYGSTAIIHILFFFSAKIDRRRQTDVTF